MLLKPISKKRFNLKFQNTIILITRAWYSRDLNSVLSAIHKKNTQKQSFVSFNAIVNQTVLICLLSYVLQLFFIDKLNTKNSLKFKLNLAAITHGWHLYSMENCYVFDTQVEDGKIWRNISIRKTNIMEYQLS